MTDDKVVAGLVVLVGCIAVGWAHVHFGGPWNLVLFLGWMFFTSVLNAAAKND